MDLLSAQELIFEKSLKSFDIDFLRGKTPVYVILFNNTKELPSEIIKLFTLSEYSHVSISFDTSLNKMYSYSKLNFTKFTMGFNQESIYAPNYRNLKYFDVFMVMVDNDRYKNIQKNINLMLNAPHEKYQYNFLGLIKYYIRLKDTREDIDYVKRTTFFCSEFVQSLIDPSKNILIAPVDLKKVNDVYHVGRFVPKTFNEKELIKNTEEILNSIKPEYETSFNPFKGLLDDEYKMAEITKRLNWQLLYKVYTKLFSSLRDAYESFGDVMYIIMANGVLKKLPEKIDAGKDYTGLVLDSLNDFYKRLKEHKLTLVDSKARQLLMKNRNEKLRFFSAKELSIYFD